jgi:ribonuclease HI
MRRPSITKYTGVAQLQPYVRIGGYSAHEPLQYGMLQTDGSFNTLTRQSRVAMILKTEDGTREIKNMVAIPNCEDSTETEWASVSHGLLFAFSEGQSRITLENDNFSVISQLIMKDSKPKKDYAKYMRYIILTTASKYEWVGIRWIPREMNKADNLFQKQLK